MGIAGNYMFISTQIAALLLLLATTDQSLASMPPSLPLNDDDRVLFLGNGYVENDQWHAYFETRIQRRFPSRTLIFRYMGWSGDNVRGSARTAGYQVPEGLGRLTKEVLALKPTVIFLSYGMNESFDGTQGLPGFLEDYAHLLQTLSPLKARLVILSPTYHEDLGRPFPDPAENNRHLRQYTEALKEFAHKREILFVDLFHPLESAKTAKPESRLTTNGLLLTRAGYALTAKAMEDQLGFPPERWDVELNKTGKLTKSEGTKLTSITTAGTTIRFEASDAVLPVADSSEVRRLRVTGLAPGNYLLKIDGHDIHRASAAQWQEGVNIVKGPMFDDTEKLRAAIVLRNQLFYRRWRPYNDHSRHWGFIGGDFKLYDQEIVAQEQRIAALRSPPPRIYEITASE
jgi:lysophospholipase L1-like esterase